MAQLTSPRFQNNTLQRVADNLLVMRRWFREDKVAVQIIQQALKDLGYGRLMPLTFARGSPDGDYGDETVAAVRQFQTDPPASFPPQDRTGFVGPKTMMALDSLPQFQTASPPPQAPQAPQTPQAPQAPAIQLDPLLEGLKNDIMQRHSPRQVRSGIDYYHAGPVHAVVMDDSRVRMGVIWRADPYTIRQSVEMFQPVVAVTGSFADIGGANPLAERAQHPAISGYVVSGGHRVSNTTSPYPFMRQGERWDSTHGHFGANGAFIAYVAGGAGSHYRFGQGIVPETTTIGHLQVTTALDGLVPVILNHQPFGPSQIWYNRISEKGAMGLVVIAYRPSAHQIIAIAQDHDGAIADINNIRDFAQALDCAHAVALDGSTSVMLYVDGWVFQQPWAYGEGEIKNRRNPNSVAFFAG